MKKIVIESHIPYIKGLLEPYAQVEYLDTAAITPAAVRDADALLVRTRTRCDASLLQDSRVSFIGTATIGTDHIDLPWCASRGIKVVNAPGCNAPAVAQWVHATIGTWLQRHPQEQGRVVLGVVGVGHVGSIVARWGRELGYEVLCCDPPRAAQEGLEGFVSLTEVQARATVITYHTPLTRTGQWPTWHMCDAAFLAGAPHLRLVLDAARGPVCDDDALLAWQGGDVAIDCWEHEPAISLPLLGRAIVATPHIAGYSSDGKHRGTAMVVQALNEHFGWHAQPEPAVAPYEGAHDVTLQRIMASYDPMQDTARLKAHPEQFEQLRNHYDLRPEVL